MSDDYGRQLLAEHERIAEFVKQNWSDPIAKQYLMWMEQTKQNIEQMERSREIINLKKMKIKLLAQSVIDGGEEDEPKVYRREHRR